MKLIVENVDHHASKGVVREFENEILAIGHLEKVQFNHRLHRLPRAILWNIVRRLPTRSIALRGKNDYFAVCMGTGHMWKCLPYFLYAKSRNIYLFDAWPNENPMIEHLLRTLRINKVFFSSLRATESFTKTMTDIQFSWVPEGVHLEAYHFKDYSKKDIDVIYFGRKWDWYHGQIVGPLAESDKLYCYEKSWGNFIFPNPGEFKAALATSKISICVPRSVTHPNMAYGISTMTSRYLQSMASKCLVVGVIPDEMKELFDYNPMIEIDKNDPAGHLLDVLKNYPDYLHLIEKNYEFVASRHTWSNRFAKIAQEI